MIVLCIILPLVVMIGVGVWAYLSYKGIEEETIKEVERTRTGWNGAEEKYIDRERVYVKNKGKIIQFVLAIVFGVVALLTLVFIPASLHQVNAGEVAVVKVWGNAKEVRTAGLHFDFWVSHKYEIYDCKVQQITTTTQAYSSDGQTMDIELVIQYKIQQDNAMEIAKTYGGLGMVESRIETVAIEKMKSVLSQKSAMNIIETRAVVSPAVEENVRNAITTDYYVDITTVVLTDISFTDAFEKTVEDKMIAEQEKLKAQYEKEKAIVQAEQALEVARLDAEAKLAEAQGEANAVEALAKAQANAIKLKSIEVARMLGFTITENVTEEGVEYNIDFTGKSQEEIAVISKYLQYIEYLSVWNGVLPTVMTDGSATIMIPTP